MSIPPWEKLKNEGNERYSKGEFREAITLYSRAIQHNSSESKLFTNRALCYLKLKDVEQCLDDASRASELEPKNAKANYLKGRCHASRSNYPAAVKYFRRGMELCYAVGNTELSSALYSDLFNAYFVALREMYQRTRSSKIAALRSSVDACKGIVQQSAKAVSTAKADEALSVLEQLFTIASEEGGLHTDDAQKSNPSARNEWGNAEGLDTSPLTPDVATFSSRPTAIPECFICPISLEVMRDPIILVNPKSGFQTYDRQSLLSHFRIKLTDPLSHDPISDPNKVMVPNKALRNAILSYLEAHPFLYEGTLEPI
jgi:STIP1 family protein 1